MTTDTHTEVFPVEERARRSLGSSDVAIYNMVLRALTERHIGGGTLVDVGCGSGNLWSFVRELFDSYVGVDVVRFDGFPEDAEFNQVNLDAGRSQLGDNSADVVVAIETIEHLENPRAFMRELVRLVKPGGWVVVTTPNQLSLLSLMTLALKHQFQAFQDTDYPAHITALLEVDLQRIVTEAGLTNTKICYSKQGRLVLTNWRYPGFVSRLFPRWFSDNILIVGKNRGE